MALLEIKDLHTYFETKRGTIKAVNGVSYSVESGKTPRYTLEKVVAVKVYLP